MLSQYGAIFPSGRPNGATTWYDNDQVYVDHAGGGYCLYNQNYPGLGIAVSISM